MQLSGRLEQLISLAGSGACAADIGTDHGLVPVELVRRGAFSRMIASDVRKGPLRGASAKVRAAGLEEKIELRLGDGLSVLEPGEADTILISGMGGALMKRLIEEGDAAAKAAKRLVLSPQSEIPAFRTFLQENGYAIVREAALCEEGKTYFFLVAEPGRQTPWEGADRLYGKYLLEERNETVLAYMKRRKAVLAGILKSLEKAEDPKAEMRLAEARSELLITEQALLASEER